MCLPAWFSVLGLSLDLLGVLVIAWEILNRTPELARQQNAALGADTPEEQEKQPGVASALREARNAKIGFLLVAVGFLLQIVAVLVRELRLRAGRCTETCT